MRAHRGLQYQAEQVPPFFGTTFVLMGRCPAQPYASTESSSPTRGLAADGESKFPPAPERTTPTNQIGARRGDRLPHPSPRPCTLQSGRPATSQFIDSLFSVYSPRRLTLAGHGYPTRRLLTADPRSVRADLLLGTVVLRRPRLLKAQVVLHSMSARPLGSAEAHKHAV